MTQPPQLPNGAPQDIDEFVKCTRDKVVLRGGTLNWMPPPTVMGQTLPPPDVTLTPGEKPGSVDIKLGYGILSVPVTATVVNGQLVVDGGMAADALGLGSGITDWVRNLNDWLAANGRCLGPLRLGPEGIALEKLAVVTTSKTEGVTYTWSKVPPSEEPYSKEPYSKEPYSKEPYPVTKFTVTPKEPEYAGTNVEPPTLPPSEAFGNRRKVLAVAGGGVALALLVLIGALVVGGGDEKPGDVETGSPAASPPPTAAPTPKTTTIDMPYTITSVGRTCDQAVQGSEGKTFDPLKYTLSRTGSDLQLANAAGTNAGKVVAAGQLDGSRFSLQTLNPRPDQGLAIFMLSGPVPAPGSSPAGSGEFWGPNDCKVGFTFTWEQSNPVLP